MLARVCLAAIIVCPAFAADETSNQFWPETGVYVTLNDRARVFFLGAAVRPGEEPAFTDGQLGAHADVFLLKGATELMVRGGYRFVLTEGAGGGTAVENRPLAEVTPRWTFSGGWSLRSRNRLEFLIKQGKFAWRFRTEQRLQKELRAGRRVFSAFATAEPFYLSTAGRWNRFRFTAGIVFPLGRHFEIEPYYARQIETDTPNVNAAGLRLNVLLRN